MSKNMSYLITTIVMLIIIAIIWSPKPPIHVPAASPTNGLTDSAPATLEKPAGETARPAAPPAVGIAPSGQAAPESAASPPPKNKAMDSDDVPASAEVAPAPTPSVPKPAEDKGMVVPPSEGQ